MYYERKLKMENMLEKYSFTDLLAMNTFIKKNQKYPYPSKKEGQLLTAIATEMKTRVTTLQNDLDKVLNPPPIEFKREPKFKRTK